MKFLASLLVLMLTGAVFAGLAALLVLHYYSSDLPGYDQLEDYAPPHVTRLYSADGRILEEYATEKRMFVPIAAIPKRVQQAFISAEDRNFYQHPGIDIVGISRAVVQNVSNLGSGRALVGGSTITQQVVKNFLLSDEKSFDRKIKEAILSFRITRSFSKDKILELYLNQIYLGGGSYGVAAAALDYFNRSVDELSVAESAFLAGLPKAPSRYSPKRNYEEAKARRDWVIGRMREDGYITAEEAEMAIRTPISLRDRDEAELAQAPSFAEEVRRQIVRDYGADALYKGGLAVHTTLEPKEQAIAEKALLDGVLAYDRRHGYRGPLTNIGKPKQWRAKLAEVTKPQGAAMWRLAVVLAAGKDEAKLGLEDGTRGVLRLEDITWARKQIAGEEGPALGPEVTQTGDVLQPGDVILAEAKPSDESVSITQYNLRQVPQLDGALVAMDPHTGRVIAMVGGVGFRNTEFNRATQAKRQPGSSFKTFIYLAAMEAGYNPSTVVADSPIEFYQGPGLPMWRPQNYSGEFYGPTTLRTGLEKSYNVMTVRLAKMLGLDRVREVSSRFGVYDNLPNNYSVILGSHETTLVNLVTGYAMIVNGGKRVHPKLIERIQDRHGKLIYRSDERPCPGCNYERDGFVNDLVPTLEDTRETVTDPLTAYQITSMLEGVVLRGTGVRARDIGKPVGGKTGTTNDSIDSWFVGFTPDLVCGVFMGFDQPRTLGRKETGASVALPAFVDFMKTALADKPSTPFRIPSGIRLTKVDVRTGQMPGFSAPDKEVIFEAFKPEAARQEPLYRNPLPEEGGEPSLPFEVEQPPSGNPNILQPEERRGRHGSTLGTGGIY